MRLDVPKFSGADPESWLFSIQEYFTLLNTPVDQRLRIVGFNLEGAAAEWFRWMTRNGLITDWPRFEESVKNRELLVSKPKTLGDAFALARVTEARLEDQGTVAITPKSASTSGRAPYQRSPSVVKTSLLPTPSKTTVNPTGKPLAIKWISSAERQDRLSKGLCFNCDNRWTRRHKCSGKFLLLMTDTDEGSGEELATGDDEAVKSGYISILNSLVGHGSPRSL
ncbi:hypothetical protein Tco_0520781 [Tanacetum coccineum]